MNLDLNDFPQEVHALAVEKGFYSPEPTDAELIAAIHAEISEAFEAWRKSEPMVWHACKSEEPAVPCESLPMCINKEGSRGAALQISDLNRRGRPIGRLEIPCGDFNLIRVKGKRKDRDICNYLDPKPLGIAAELIDVVLRVLDAAAAHGVEISTAAYYYTPEHIGEMDAPNLAAYLHYETSVLHTRTWYNGDMYGAEGAAHFSRIATAILTWLRAQGIDPDPLLREKHEYNKTRPYRHGGKRA